jgi:hypothetical protein
MTNSYKFATQRRAFLRGSAAVGAATLCAPSLMFAQSRQGDAAESVHVTQLLDMSPDQQQLSRDYATGIRLAFFELKKANQSTPQLATVETDGSAAQARAALKAIHADASQVALLGTVGESLALASLQESTRAGLDIAHVAPWLADPQLDRDPRLFALFASREEQIRQVLKNMSVVGIGEVGLVYPSPRHEQALRSGMEAIAARLSIKTRNLVVPAGQDAATYAATLADGTPAYLLFMGGSIELALFTQGLSRRGMQRYVLALSDVDTNTFLQLNPGKAVPVIFTDVVPNPYSSKVPIVRAYRTALQKYFDEAPSPVSLAGYLAGRYAANVLASLGPKPTRAQVLAEFQRRRPVELDGWRLEFTPSGRASTFVTQTLLNSQGRFVG